MRFFTNNFSKNSMFGLIGILLSVAIYYWYQPPEYKQSFSNIVLPLLIVSLNIAYSLFIVQWTNNNRNISSKYPGEDKLLSFSIILSVILLAYVSYTLGRVDTLYEYDIGNIIDALEFGYNEVL